MLNEFLTYANHNLSLWIWCATQVGGFAHHFGSLAPWSTLPNACFHDVWDLWARLHDQRAPHWMTSNESGWVRSAHWNNNGMTVPEALYYLRAFRFNPKG